LQWEVLFLPGGEVTGNFSTLIDNGNGIYTLGFEVHRFVGASSLPQLAILLNGVQLPGSPWTPAWVASFPASAGTLGMSVFAPYAELLGRDWAAGSAVTVGRVSLKDEFGNSVSGAEHAALLSGTAEPASTSLDAAINPMTAPIARQLIFSAENDGSYSVSVVVEVRRCLPFHAVLNNGFS
jgi:hypothetical protein